MRSITILLLLTLQSFAQTAPPLPGHRDSLDRWMSENKVDASIRSAMRVCEDHVVKPSNEPADLTYLKQYPFEADWADSCNAIRSKMFESAKAAKAAKIDADRSMIDNIAKGPAQ